MYNILTSWHLNLSAPSSKLALLHSISQQ